MAKFRKITLLATVAAVLAVPFLAYAQGVITTVAGSPWVFPPSANGGPATNAPLISITGVAVDLGGNVFATDPDNNLVVRISPDGILTIIAGTGTAGYSGDGGPATSAALYIPEGIALDAAGNLYIADDGNNRIRKVTPGGMISTVAGNGSHTSISGTYGDGGPAIYAYINGPLSVAVDVDSNLYISEPGRIRKVDSNGTISTVAGTGRQGFSGDGGPAVNAQVSYPHGLAVDEGGNLYIADSQNYRIRKVDSNGTITTVAGTGQHGFSGDGGLATNAQVFYPQGVAVDAMGTLYIAEFGNNPIRKVTPDGTISTVGNGPGGSSVAPDNFGNLYVGDGSFVRAVSQNGTVVTIAGSGMAGFYGDGGPATAAHLSWPDGIAVAADGSVYISDSSNDRVRKVSPDGVIRTVAGNKYGFSGDGGPAASADLEYPRGIALDASGDLYIADENNSRVRKISPDGTITTVAGNGQPGFSGDGGLATSAQLYYPQGVAVDTTTGNLYIADSSNYRIRMVTPQGTISTVAGTGQAGFSGDGGLATSAQLATPSAVALDAAGNLYVVDSTVCYPATCAAGAQAGYGTSSSNQRIRKVDRNGVITTVAGNGTGSFSGDGGPAISAALCFPEGVAVDAAGNIYILDSGNDRIRKIDAKGMISTVAGNAQLNLSVADYLKAGGAVALDAAGNLYIADLINRRVIKVTGPATPYFLGSSALNAASFLIGSPSGAVAPGSLVSIFGQNLAYGVQSASAPLLPRLLDTTVSIDGLSAPLLYVSPGQINAQVPFEVTPGTVPIEVRRTSTGAATASLNVTAAAPGIFAINGSGTGQGAILTSTGELAAPTGSVPGRQARPARGGEFISIFATGLGDVSNRPASGAPAPSQSPYSETILKPTVTIGGLTITPSFSGLAPFFVGLYQVNVQVPDGAPTGDAVHISLSIGAAVSNTVTIAVQ